jgi:hypothetical protein
MHVTHVCGVYRDAEEREHGTKENMELYVHVYIHHQCMFGIASCAKQ